MYWSYLRNILTGFLIILIPVYWHYYGFRNFLWFSDIALFLTLLALWLESPLLMSMAAVGVFVLEALWCIDFFTKLIWDKHVNKLSDYMFNPAYPLTLRALSLFHLVTPIIWLLYLAQYGYDTRALFYFTILYWCIILITRFTTPINDNINWVFLPEVKDMPISSSVWLLIMLIGIPLCIFLPTHYLFKILFNAV